MFILKIINCYIFCSNNKIDPHTIFMQLHLMLL